MSSPIFRIMCLQRRTAVVSAYSKCIHITRPKEQCVTRHHPLCTAFPPQSARLYSSKSSEHSSHKARSYSSKAQPAEHHPQKGTLVYVGTISGQVKLVKMFSLSSSIVGLCLQPVLYTKAVASTLPTVLKFVLGGFFNFFIFATPVLLHVLSKRYVTTLYYNDKTEIFTATTYNFLVRQVETSFTREEVDTQSAGMLTTMKVNKKPFFFDPEMFLDHQAFIRMMRYDEPLDLSFKPGEYAGQAETKKESES